MSNLDGPAARSDTSAEAALIARAINRGWVGRGFMLGVGFWLAGLFIAVIGFVLFVVFGAAMLAAGSAHQAATADPAAFAPDSRSSQERLKASDDAIAQSRQYLDALKHHRAPAGQ